MADQYDLEPDVDGELVERVREYSLRKDGRYVEGVVTNIKGKKRGRIGVVVETPMEEFTHTFKEPSPKNGELEEVANEYGQGLVDIGSLVGETVWCTEVDRAWKITIRRGRLGQLKERLESADSDTVWEKFVTITLAPLDAMLISHQQHEGERWSHKSKPSNHKIAWKNGALSVIWFAVFWTVFALLLFRILL